MIFVLTKKHFFDCIPVQPRGQKLKGMIRKIIKHQQAILLGIFLIASFVALKTSDEPILGVFRNTPLESIFQQFYTGNSIFFNLSIGFIISCFFYVLIVWLPRRSNALHMKTDSAQFRNVLTTILEWRRFFYIEVENLHPSEIARYCLVYLESLKDLSTNEKRLLPLVEFKWEGILTQSVSITAKKSRRFDAFYVFCNSPDTVHLGINDKLTDDPDFFGDYAITGPGDFELTFIIYSENFLPQKATFKLHIGNTLRDIRFE